MRVTLVHVWVILVWLHFPSSNFNQYCLQALNLHRFPFLPKHSSTFQWRGNPAVVSSHTATSAPRKYRHIDVQEEYARERSGVHDYYPPHQWLDRIRQKLKPLHRNVSARAVTDEFPSASLLNESKLQGRALPLNSSEASTTVPVLESLLRLKQPQCIVTNVNELRSKILDDGLALSNIKIECPYVSAGATISDVLKHDVIQLMVARYHSQSRPGQRHGNDTAYLALAIEGGGIRGAVCSGMAAAIAALGLTDSFDTIIGSSAGSVIGAYMVRFVISKFNSYLFQNSTLSHFRIRTIFFNDFHVYPKSRQMCVDVYLDILPAAKRLFACTKRLLHSISVTALDVSMSKLLNGRFRPQSLLPKGAPGMNTSFILDGIMNCRHGLRPLDINSFRTNDRRQPLRVASSYAKNGKLYSKCFGTENFFDGNNATTDSFVRRVDGSRDGLFACLEASMTVPGASGDPVRIADKNTENGLAFFDAFCFEPLPYRSAVEAGATHVLVLCSRPEGFQPKTTPGIYENGVANMYFKAHNEPEVANFFERGGQQYIYAEDLLTLEEGKLSGMNHGDPVHVPPPTVLYGVNRDDVADHLAMNRDQWKTAHLLPLKVPIGTKELPSLEQDREAIGNAVRGGFAAAFDLLAPAIGLQLDHNLTGMDVANLLFPPDMMVDDFVLEHQLHVKGDCIPAKTDPLSSMKSSSLLFRPKMTHDRVHSLFGDNQRLKRDILTREHKSRAEHLLQVLPGFASGRMAHLAIGLKTRSV